MDQAALAKLMQDARRLGMDYKAETRFFVWDSKQDRKIPLEVYTMHVTNVVLADTTVLELLKLRIMERILRALQRLQRWLAK